MTSYYDQLELLRDHMAAHGHDHAARELLTAERSGATFGGVINNVGLVLRRLIDGKLDDDLRPEVEAMLREGKRLWDSSNR